MNKLIYLFIFLITIAIVSASLPTIICEVLSSNGILSDGLFCFGNNTIYPSNIIAGGTRGEYMIPALFLTINTSLVVIDSVTANTFNASDWGNVTITESQITDLQAYLKNGTGEDVLLHNGNFTGNVTADSFLISDVGLIDFTSNVFNIKNVKNSGTLNIEAGDGLDVDGGGGPGASGGDGGIRASEAGEGGSATNSFIVALGGDGGANNDAGGRGGAADSGVGSVANDAGNGGVRSSKGGLGGTATGPSSGTNTGGDGGDWIGGGGDAGSAVNGAINVPGSAGDGILKGGDGGVPNGDAGDAIVTSGRGRDSGADGKVQIRIGGFDTIMTFLADKSGVQMNDNIKFYYGSGKDREDYWDGTNAIINTTTGDLHLLNNSGFGTLIYGTLVQGSTLFDKSEGTALSKIEDVSNYYDNEGNINHLAHYAYTQRPVTDFDRPELEFYNVTILDENGKEKVILQNRTIYPHTKLEDFIDTSEIIATTEQAVYELKTENQMLKDELCNAQQFWYWCKTIFNATQCQYLSKYSWC